MTPYEKDLVKVLEMFAALNQLETCFETFKKPMPPIVDKLFTNLRTGLDDWSHYVREQKNVGLSIPAYTITRATYS
jgi:hypothetical protein